MYGMQNEIYRVPFEAKPFIGLSFNLVIYYKSCFLINLHEKNKGCSTSL